MRSLLATTGLGALAAALATSTAYAETVINSATTSPVTTSTTGDLRITSAGSIKPTSGVAVTINSNAKVNNEGTIAITGSNGSTGILANSNLSGDITNAGSITIDESYTPTDSDKDGDLDGPFAQGSNRYGIQVVGGGSYTGNIRHSGQITIEGNQSAGIAIDSALVGSLTSTGKISVLGNDSFAIRTSSVSGDVKITAGTVLAQGQNSIGVMLGGDVGGSVVIQTGITSTGYRYTTPPADPSKLDSDDLLQGGPAVVVAGSVAGGILLDAPPPDTNPNDNDEDDDGVVDAQELTATLVSYGAAPALLIGSSTQDISIGAVGSTGNALVIKGNVAGSGLYKSVSATGVSIGGTGHSVTLAGGIDISGQVVARSVDSSATALNIGAGASVPTLTVSGTLNAQGGGTTSAVLIDSGATVNTIKNSGSITAAHAATSGSAAAIVDKSGTLSLIENSGLIGASNASSTAGQAVAIDLRANTLGAEVRQVAAATGKPAPKISGNILFGSGNDTLSILAGSLIGNVDFGGGSDIFALGGLFRGELLNSAGVALNVGSGGVLDLRNAGTVDLASLTTGANAALGVRIGADGHTLYNVAGEAVFGAGTKVIVSLDKVSTAAGTYTIIDAGTLTGASNLTSSVVTLPFLFNSALTSSEATGEVKLDISLKGAGQLGLNTSETAILDAALAAADGDIPLAAVFLTADNSTSLKSTLQQLMPEHAGGTFETVSKGVRLSADLLGERRAIGQGGLGMWLEQFGWSSTKSIGSTANYKVSGWGATAGVEKPLGPIGSVGVTASYVGGRDSKGENDLVSDHFEGGLYWRGGMGPLRAYARAAAGIVSFNGTRNFHATVNGAQVNRSSEGSWDGRLYSAAAGLSYEVRAGRLSLRPSASIDAMKLTEDGYTESGGGEAFDLTVHDRSSSETGVNALMAVGYDLLGTARESSWLRVELQGGRREILSGSLGETVASFGDGETFTLAPEQRTAGWRGALRLLGGGPGMSVAAEIGGEQLHGRAAFSGRVGVNFAM